MTSTDAILKKAKRGNTVLREEGALEATEVDGLLRVIAEQLRLPLCAIARQAELGQLTGDVSLKDLSIVHTQATAALTLVDSYLLGLQLMHAQTSLELEPVSVSALLVDVAHELDGFAKQYDTRLKLHIGGRFAPVMAHRRGLKAALLALTYGLLEANVTPGEEITLAVHRTPKGIITGVYGSFEGCDNENWRRALTLMGKASQPIAAVPSNGAMLFIAHTILRAMSSRLRPGMYMKGRGLVTTLPTSQQLSLV